MSFLNTLNNYLVLMLVALIVGGLIAAFVVLYALRVKKVATTEEHLDYSSFNRVDSTEYAKFKDIISIGGDGPGSLGMVQMSDYIFVGGIDVQGYNFFGASPEERRRTMVNSIAFFSIVDNPIQLRQTTKDIDLSQNVEDTKECAKRIERSIIDKRAEYAASAELLNNEDILDNDEVYKTITDRLDRLKKEISSLNWQLTEAERLVQYLNDVSGASANKKKVTQVFFKYIYNPDDELTELTKEEILLKAGHELGLMAQKYGGALEGCGCTYKTLTADDMTDLLRRHYHPKSVDEVSLTDLLNSSYSALYVSGRDLEDIERERVGEIIYEQNEREAARLAEEARTEAQERLTTANAMAQGQADALFQQALGVQQS